jgi:hypothetical protein
VDDVDAAIAFPDLEVTVRLEASFVGPVFVGATAVFDFTSTFVLTALILDFATSIVGFAASDLVEAASGHFSGAGFAGPVLSDAADLAGLAIGFLSLSGLVNSRLGFSASLFGHLAFSGLLLRTGTNFRCLAPLLGSLALARFLLGSGPDFGGLASLLSRLSLAGLLLGAGSDFRGFASLLGFLTGTGLLLGAGPHLGFFSTSLGVLAGTSFSFALPILIGDLLLALRAALLFDLLARLRFALLAALTFRSRRRA